MTKEQLLGEVEELLRTIPSNDEVRANPNGHAAWVGRAAAVIERWDVTRTPWVTLATHETEKTLDWMGALGGYRRLAGLLQHARADLRMEVGRLSVVVPQGQVFEYFEELRKAVETARMEVFFVDPYLDPDFVGHYLPHVTSGATVRLLGHAKMAGLLSAVDMFTKQSGFAIQVRSSAALHDRFLFVDRKVCYLSGASFKDGARNAPATLTLIVDAFQAMWDTYDQLWKSAKVERT